MSEPDKSRAETVTVPPVHAVTADFAPGGDTGEVVAGKYTLLERLGEGGMGEVWVAKQTQPVQRKVAVKLIKAGMDSKSVLVRFDAERQALALMDHPNIAKVLDGGLTDRGRPFFVMELVNGLPLTKYCDEARLTPRERLALFLPVCQAIQHAHQKGIVHRDLKPTNILVTLYDGRPVPKVIDFGVAKATGGRLTDATMSTQFGAVVGTFEYMAPEQAGFSALDVDTRADIYSLGVILYELLTGLRPFEGSRLRKAALDEMFRILREEDPPRPSTKLSTDASLPTAAAVRRTDPRKLAALLRGELDWIVLKCLEKDRTRRYESASALGRDVERYLADEPVEARPPSAAYRLRKFARRNRAAVITTAAIVVGALAAAGGQTWNLLRARDAERRAVEAEAIAVRERATAEEQRKAAQAESERARAAEVEQGKEAARARAAEAEQARARAQAETNLVRSDGLRLASEASIVRANDPGLALLLGLEAVRRYPHHLTFTALYDAAADLRERRTIAIGLYDVKGVRLSPDGTKALAFAGGGSNQTAAVIDLATGKVLTSWRGFGAGAGDLDWSPDGARAVATFNHRVSVRFTDGKQPDSATFTERAAYVWDAGTGRDLVHLRGHEDKVVSARFSPDGTKVVTASWDGTARLWDAVSGKELHVFRGHVNSVLTARFSPDGRRVLTVSAQQTQSAGYRDPDTGKARPQQGTNLDPGPTTRPWEPSGSSMSSSGGSRRMDQPLARVWDVETGQQVGSLKFEEDIGTPFGGARFRPVAVAVSPDGTRVAIAFEGDTVGVWDAAGGTERFVLRGQRSRATALAFSPDGVDLVTVGDGGAVTLWNATTGKEVRRFEGHGNHTVSEVRFSADGRRLVTAGADQTARAWHVSTGKELAVFRGHSGWVRGAYFLPDGESVLTVGDTTGPATLRVWSVGAVPAVPLKLHEPDPPSGRLARWFGKGPARHTGSVTALAFTADGRSVLTGAGDMSVRRWDAATGRQTALVTSPLRGTVDALAVGPDGTVFAGTAMNYWGPPEPPENRETHLSLVVRWDPATGKVMRFLKGQNREVEHLELSADGARLLLLGGPNRLVLRPSGPGRPEYLSQSHDRIAEVSVWDARTGDRLGVLPALDQSSRPRPRFRPNGSMFVYLSSKQDELALYDGRTAARLRTLANPKGGWQGRWVEARFSPDGRVVVGQRQGDADLWFWDAATGELLGPHRNPHTSASGQAELAFSPDGKRMAYVADRLVQVVDVSTRASLAVLRGHEARVTVLTFSPDGKRLLTGSEDKTAALWDVESGRLLTVYRGHPDAVRRVAYSPDGKRIATASGMEPLARVWPVDVLPEFENRKPRELTGSERIRYELPPARERK
jgi:WD40 repeat protein/serine/threonine protein kinase